MKKTKQIQKLPSLFKPILWSYNLKDIDLEKDKRIILTNTLIYGPEKATDWIFQHYSNPDIKDVLTKPIKGVWDKKSYSLWCRVFNVPFSRQRNLYRQLKP